MRLYYKEWDKEPVEIPRHSVIFDDKDLALLKRIRIYPSLLCWEVWIIQEIERNTKGYFDFSKNLVDIGAGVGEYSWTLPFKHAYAFEPNKTMIYKLHANAVLYDKVNDIDTYQCLLSDKVEEVNFDGFFTDDGGYELYNNENSLKIKTTTLDTFNLDNIGLIKIDVEGMEEKVLRGGIGTIIRNNYPPILFECWEVGTCGMTQEKHDKLFDYIKSLGYEIFEFWGDSETHLAINSKYYNS